MSRRPVRLATFLVLALCVASSPAFLSGCATTGTAPAPGDHGGKAVVPAEITVRRNLKAGDSWKSRFVSTSEMKRTLTGADGKATVKARTVGLELVAVQKVASIDGSAARIEVDEISARILQEGKFIDAPFRRFNPPNPVSFTLDLGTGKADFPEMEKAYSDWMASVKEGPAGEILGKTFRLDAYVAQLKDLYSRPFNRVAGKTLSKEPRAGVAGEFVLPFLGPGVALGPVPVETTSWYEGMDVKGGLHLLKAAGKYSGTVAWTPAEMKDRLEDFAAPVPAEFRSSGEASGTFVFSVDVLSGREVRSESHLRYSVTASWEGGTLSEEITGKSTLDPAD